MWERSRPPPSGSSRSAWAGPGSGRRLRMICPDASSGDSMSPFDLPAACVFPACAQAIGALRPYLCSTHTCFVIPGFLKALRQHLCPKCTHCDLYASYQYWNSTLCSTGVLPRPMQECRGVGSKTCIWQSNTPHQRRMIFPFIRRGIVARPADRCAAGDEAPTAPSCCCPISPAIARRQAQTIHIPHAHATAQAVPPGPPRRKHTPG